MAIEDVGCNPERLAAAIHDQLGLAKGPVPVAAIAAALDIVEIRTAATRGLEGALVTTEERSEGIIMVRAGATSQRPSLHRRPRTRTLPQPRAQNHHGNRLRLH